MSQVDLLKKLKTGQITVLEFLDQSEDTSLDQYKLTKEGFFNNPNIAQSTKDHELKHAAVYEAEGMEVEFYFFGESERKAATSVTKESLIRWLNKKNTKDYIELMKNVTSAPGKEMGYTDKQLLDALND